MKEKETSTFFLSLSSDLTYYTEMYIRNWKDEFTA